MNNVLTNALAAILLILAILITGCAGHATHSTDIPNVSVTVDQHQGQGSGTAEPSGAALDVSLDDAAKVQGLFAPDSCTGECYHHCPPWKDPTENINCLVSCANTGDWACYSDDCKR